MKTATIEIPSAILSALAAAPADPQLAMETCRALVEAATILGGVPPAAADTATPPDPAEIVERARKRRQRREAAARRRALRRQESDRRLAQFIGKGIRDTSLSDLKAGGILSRAELRIIEAMLRPTIQLTNKLTAKQLEGILRPRIGRVMEKARSAILQLQDSAPYDIVSRKSLTSQQPQAQRPTGYAPGGGSCCNANVRSPWRH